MNTIFQILYLTTVLYLIVLYFSLFKNVVRLRRQNKEAIGFSDEELHRAVRAHANFCETVPFCLLISLILYFNSYHFICFIAIFILCIGRKIHSKSISDLKENLSNRKRGMQLTATAFFLLILGILYHICNLLYYFSLSNFINTT